jgi:hypothetical protein
MVRTIPLSENFQFFLDKIMYFIEKKDRKIKKNCLAPPQCKKPIYGSFNFPKNFFAPPHFFFAARPCY